MKYLRKYEELEPEVYRRAADLLKKKGYYHKDRSVDMYNHADFVQWSKFVKEVKDNGVVKAKIETSRTVSYKNVGEDYVGDFYPRVEFGIDIATEHLDWREQQILSKEMDPKDDFSITIHLFISLVPATKEVYYGAKEAIVEYTKNKTGYHDLSNLAQYPLAFFHFDISFSGGSYEFSKPSFYRRDDGIVDATLVDRNGSGKIRNAIINSFSPNVSYENTVMMGGHNFTFDNYRETFNGMLQHFGLSSDFGLELDIEDDDKNSVYKYIKSIPGNFFTC
jgi:hypothetical protein